MENEYARIPKHRGTEKKIKQLKENCEELCKEVNQKKAEINAIKEDVSSKKKLMLIDKKETEKLLEKQANLKDELVRILGVPVKLGKEAEKINCKKNDEEKKKKALNDQIEELNGTLKAIERRTEEILQEKEDIMKELDGKQILLESKERECSTLSKLLEINREKELVVVAERLDINRVACVNNSVFSKISFFSLLYCLCFQVLCCNHCGVEIIKLGFDFRNVYINY